VGDTDGNVTYAWEVSSASLASIFAWDEQRADPAGGGAAAQKQWALDSSTFPGRQALRIGLAQRGPIGGGIVFGHLGPIVVDLDGRIFQLATGSN
jgi:hypothetical protein